MGARDEAQTVQIGVRMKEPLRAALEEAAKKRGVSLNAEAVRRIERSFEPSTVRPLAIAVQLFGVVISILRDILIHAERKLKAAGVSTDDLAGLDQFDNLQAALESMKRAIAEASARERQ